MTLRIEMSATTVGADHAVRLAHKLSSICGGFRYTVLSPFNRKFHKLIMVTDNHHTEMAILDLMRGESDKWNHRIVSRFHRTMANIKVEYWR